MIVDRHAQVRDVDLSAPRPDDAAMPTILSALALALALLTAVSTPPEFQRLDGAAVNGQTIVAAPAPVMQRLAILPDRTTGRDWGLRYLKQAVEDLNRFSPDAVFTIGDMIQGYTRDVAEWDRQVAEYMAIVGGLTMPVYAIAGNHDVIGGTRRAGDDDFAERYRHAFGPLWYAVELEHVTMIVLFSDEALGDRGLTLSDAQLAWLESALTTAQARERPIVMLMHRPLWRSASVKWETRVQPMLERFGVSAVIAGHFHSMQRDKNVGGVEYHIVGVCGGSIDQHPYAGQMQHLSFLDVLEDGTLRFHHMHVGATLPNDWVVRQDQDRVFKLRNTSGVLQWKSATADPYLAPRPVLGEVELEFHNPLDVPVEVSLEQIRQVPGPWLIGRENFVSWTPVDTFNPATTELIGPFNISALTRHHVDPGETTQIPVRHRATPISEPVPPAPIEFKIEFLDRTSRVIPVTIPLRLPIQRVISMPTDLASAQPFPLCVWSPSVYDTLDANPTCRLSIDRADDGDQLLVEVRVPDLRPSAYEHDDRTFEARRDDPIGDAVRIMLATPSRTIDCLTEPFAARTFGDPCSAEAPERWSDGKGWTQRIRVPWPGGRFDPNMPTTVNVGVADNDDTYHTQWRWLAPRDLPAQLQGESQSPRRR